MWMIILQRSSVSELRVMYCVILVMIGVIHTAMMVFVNGLLPIFYILILRDRFSSLDLAAAPDQEGKR